MEDPPRAPSGGTVELKAPPGIEHLDRIAESFARADQIAALRQQIENDWIESRLAERKNPHKARTEYDPIARADRETPSLHRSRDDK